MMYNLLNDLISLLKDYELDNPGAGDDLDSFLKWINVQFLKPGKTLEKEPEWPGKINGRSADSVFNTSLVHLYRYAKIQAKTAINETIFSTPDDF
ncbi:MAG: MarR family transcriptional regulator, partial [Sphingobacteriales bacterium]